MSWGVTSKRECANCGFVFEQDEDTLSAACGDYGKCPKCGGTGKVIQRRTREDLEKILKTGKWVGLADPKLGY